MVKTVRSTVGLGQSKAWSKVRRAVSLTAMGSALSIGRLAGNTVLIGSLALGSLNAGCERKKSAEDWAGEGAAYLAQNNHGEALRCFNRALELRPDFVAVLLSKGNIYALERKFPEALSTYDEGLKYKPNLFSLWFNRALVLVEMEKYSEAEISLDKALKIKPEDEDAQGLKCKILIKRGDSVGFVQQCFHERAIREGVVKRDKNDDAIFEMMRMLEQSRRVHQKTYERMKEAGATF